MTDDATAHAALVVSRLRAEFEPHRNPQQAASMAHYMKDQFGFLGISAPQRRALQRAAWAGLSSPDDAALAAVLDLAWTQPEREYQYAAMDYLARFVDRVGRPDLLAAVERAIATTPWWDTVDHLCRHGAGALVLQFPELATEMDRWRDSGELWLIRSALLHQERWKEPDMEWVFAACAQHAQHRDFFVRKAIGWILRTWAHRGPAQAGEVRAFLAAHPELSGLSQREALMRVKW